MPLVRCTICQMELDVDPRWLGQSIRCSECESVFVAPAPPPAVVRPATPLPQARPAMRRPDADEQPSSRATPRRQDDEGDRPRSRRREDAEDEDHPRRRRREDDEDDDFDDRPRRRPPTRRKSGGSKTVLIVLLALGGVVLLGCGGGGFWIYSAINSPVRFESSAWREHALADGSCSAQFPVFPESEPITDVGVTGTKYLYAAKGFKDAAMMFGNIDYTNADPGVFERAYLLERDEVRRAMNARIVREGNIAVQGYQAKEIEYESEGTTVIYRLVHIPGPVRTRIVMLMAGGRNLTIADRTKFLDSFRVKRRI